MGAERRGLLATMVVRSLRNNARISAWTLLTLTTCAALVTLVTTAAFDVGSKMRSDLRRRGANAVAYPAGPQQADWPALDAVARSTGTLVVRVTTHVAMIGDTPVAVASADPHALALLTPYWAVTGARADATGECLVGRHVAEVLHLNVGQAVQVDGERFRVTGIAETGDEDDDRLFIAASPPAKGFTYALVSAAGGEQGITHLQVTLADARANVTMKPLRQVVYGEQHVLEKVNLLFLTTLGAVLTLTALGVSAAMLARVVERRSEFALLQALGAQRRAVVTFLLAESATVGMIGATLGFVVGTVLAMLVVRDVFHVTIGPRWVALAAALGTTTTVSLLSGAVACGRTLQFRPAAALRGE